MKYLIAILLACSTIIGQAQSIGDIRLSSWNGTTWTSITRTLSGTGAVFANYYNVLDYGASGSSFRTTGGITEGSTTLNVVSGSTFEVGQGILIMGSGSGGTHLVTTISAVSGTTITLSGTAVTTVASGTVQHDDTAAINLATDAAYNAGGGVVFFPKTGCDGVYRVNGPYRSETNSPIGFPVALATAYPYFPKVVKMRGEVAGSISADGRTAYGVCIDSTDIQDLDVAYPAIISSGAYVATTFNTTGCNFYDLSIDIDDLTIFTPSGKKVGAISASNSVMFWVGNNVRCVVQWTGTVPIFTGWGTTGPADPALAGSVGIATPQPLNLRVVHIGSAMVVGYSAGINAYEHSVFDRTTIAYCYNGLQLLGGGHLISGSISIEQCPYALNWQASTVDIELSIERGNSVVSPGGWWHAIYDFAGDASGLIGIIKYECLESGGTPAEVTLAPGAAIPELLLVNLLTLNPVVSGSSRTLTVSSGANGVYTGTGGHTWTMPVGPQGRVQPFYFKNRGSGSLTLSASGTDQFFTTTGTSGVSLSAGDSKTIQWDGTYWNVAP